MTIAQHILRTLAYYDVFGYPLKADEIYRFLQVKTDAGQFLEALYSLVTEERVFAEKEFYSLHDDVALASRRKENNVRAAKMLVKAESIGRFLYQFPFVRFVGISGSLSKQVAGADADIDFFIITASGRLWIARTLLHLLKKISFVFGKQHWLCMNYFIDEEELVIAEKNIFTATEVVTLKPVAGNTAYLDFCRANNWAFDQFPNMRKILYPSLAPKRNGWFKKISEWIFTNRWANRLDDYLMQLTRNRWLAKEQKQETNTKGEPLALLVQKNAARPNPENLQRKIVCCYQQKITDLDKDEWQWPGNYFLRKEII